MWVRFKLACSGLSLGDDAEMHSEDLDERSWWVGGLRGLPPLRICLEGRGGGSLCRVGDETTRREKT